MKPAILLLVLLCGICFVAGCCEFCPPPACPNTTTPCQNCPTCPATPCPTCNTNTVSNCIQPMKTIIVDAPVETTSYTVKAFVNPDKKIGLMVGPNTALDGTWSYDPSNNARILFTTQRGSSETYTGFIELYDNHKATITISNWPLKAMGTWSQ